MRTSLWPRPSPWLVVFGTLAACGSSSSSAPSNPTDGGADSTSSGGDTGTTPSDTGTSPTDTGISPTDTGTAPPDGSTSCDAPVVPAGLALQSVVDPGGGSLGALVFASQPPGSTDWYAVDQTGRIRIIRGGKVLATPFLDISKGIGNGGASGLGERGLLSIAFHPNYATNGRFFVGFTVAEGNDGSIGATNTDHVAEYARDAANPDIAKVGRVQAIVDLSASASNHNGGTALFGPDGKLYYGTGDGGGACNDNQPGAPQDVNRLWGKILRLDVDVATPFAPTDNPFIATTPKGDARVWHYGLRNPFRYGFDSLTHDLYIGDVGQDTYEEHDFVAANAPGKNFGWNQYEGAVQNTCKALTLPLQGPSPYTPPIISIDRTNSSDPFHDYQAAVGGRVYRGTAIPSLQGVYIFGDEAGGEVGFLRQCGTQTSPAVAVAESKISNKLQTLTSILYGNDGEVYFTFAYNPSETNTAATLGKLVCTGAGC